MHTFHFCDSDPHVHTLIITGSPCASQLQVRVSELEAEVHSTRQEVRRMEDRNMELCESPFINDVLERQQLVNKVVVH